MPDIVVAFTVPEELVRLRSTIDVEILDSKGAVLAQLLNAVEVARPGNSDRPSGVLEAPSIAP